MHPSVGELLERRVASDLVGREAELHRLSALLDPQGPLVGLVHGIGGIGKSALMRGFAARARSTGATVVAIDGGEVEPTAAGLTAAIGRAAGASECSLPGLRERLESLGGCFLLLLDTYERLTVLDPWIRRELVPALPGHSRLVLAGREIGLDSWGIATPGGSAAVMTLRLGPLNRSDATTLLQGAGFPEQELGRVADFCRGHPLALRVATSALLDTGHLPAADAAVDEVIDVLTRTYLADLEPATRRMVEVASVARRVTEPLLARLLPDLAPQDVVERLRALSFVELRSDGLQLHESVQQAVAAGLSRTDPETYRSLRRAAWEHIQEQLARSDPSQLWRHTADLLWLIDNPVVREAFFPSAGSGLSVEPALAADREAVFALVAEHEPPEGADVLAAWWEADRSFFRVVRSARQRVEGFYVLADADRIPVGLRHVDPVVEWWLRHRQDSGVPRAQTILLFRRLLARGSGEAPSAAQAACWLDVKRIYLEMRPQLRRLYAALVDPAPYAEVSARLGFVPLPEPVTVGPVTYWSSMLDFGPSSVDGWLSRLAASELGITPSPGTWIADHELHLGEQVVPLSRLEAELLAYLMSRPGRAVSRVELLNSVWGNSSGVGSNVVDALVRTLRKKVQGTPCQVETVRGVGYRYRP